jgi:hypothetical protein
VFEPAMLDAAAQRVSLDLDLREAAAQDQAMPSPRPPLDPGRGATSAQKIHPGGPLPERAE